MACQRHPIVPLQALLLSIVVIISANAPALAQWRSNGSPLTEGQAWAHVPLSVASDGADGVYALSGDFLDFLDPILSHLSASGELAPGWTADGLFVNRYPYWSFFPTLISDGTGGAFVISNEMYCLAHCTGDETELRVRHFLPSGGRDASWPDDGISIGSGLDKSTPRPVEREPVSIFSGHGSILTTWARRQSWGYGFSPIELRIQRVDANGAMPWGLSGIAIHSFASRGYDQAMAPDGNGGAFVFWLDDRPPGLYAQHVLEDGTVAWPADGVPVSASRVTIVGSPVAVPDGQHGAIVAWAGTSGLRAGVFAACITIAGQQPWHGDRVIFDGGPSYVDEVHMVRADGAGAVLAWRVLLEGSTDNQVLAQKINGAGKSVWPQVASVCAAEGRRDRLAMTTDGRGGAYLAWIDSRTEFAVYGMRIAPSGQPAHGWTKDGSPVCARFPLLTSIGGGIEVTALDMTATDASPARTRDAPLAQSGTDAIVVWVDNRLSRCETCGSSQQSAFAMLLTPDGPATAPTTPTVAIEKPQAQHSRQTLAPSVLSLKCGAQGSSTLSLSLLDDSPAALELFDLAGRKLWSRGVGLLGPGTHLRRIGDGAWLPAGVYMARLTQGTHVAVARVAVIH